MGVDGFLGGNTLFYLFYAGYLLYWQGKRGNTVGIPRVERKEQHMVWMKKKDKREQVEYISVADICPNPHQPRTVFDEGALSSLADSIRRYGLLQPISVRMNSMSKPMIT